MGNIFPVEQMPYKVARLDCIRNINRKLRPSKYTPSKQAQRLRHWMTLTGAWVARRGKYLEPSRSEKRDITWRLWKETFIPGFHSPLRKQEPFNKNKGNRKINISKKTNLLFNCKWETRRWICHALVSEIFCNFKNRESIKFHFFNVSISGQEKCSRVTK